VNALLRRYVSCRGRRPSSAILGVLGGAPGTRGVRLLLRRLVSEATRVLLSSTSILCDRRFFCWLWCRLRLILHRRDIVTVPRMPRQPGGRSVRQAGSPTCIYKIEGES
jgi:hypothetical protein